VVCGVLGSIWVLKGTLSPPFGKGREGTQCLSRDCKRSIWVLKGSLGLPFGKVRKHNMLSRDVSTGRDVG
jgi:hypothetical protein